MENLRESIKKAVNDVGYGLRDITLVLGFTLGITNFSYSQDNGGKKGNKTEQVSESGKKAIELYKIKVTNRNNNIVNNTNETIDEFVMRLQKQFEYEIGKNSDMQQKIYGIKHTLNNKYSKNITNDNSFFILQTAIKTIAGIDKYAGLEYYSNKFSGKFDINFVNALGYIQYINDLSCNGTLSGKNGESTLSKIIEDLNSKGNNQLYENATSNTGKNNFKGKENENKKNEQRFKKQETKLSNIDNKANKVKSDYSAKIENRNKNITSNTSESLDEFAKRMNMQFEYEVSSKNSLIGKKVGNIKELLNSKYNYKLGDNKILIIESALTELSKTEKYKGLQEYVNKFSGNFDLNFIDAYGYVQYINDWNCNRSLCGKIGAFILQSIYDDLSDIEKNNGKNHIEDNGLNHDNTVQPGMDIDNDVSDPTENDIPNIKPDYREMEGISLLSKNLSSDKLDGITYEDIWNTVDGFKHEGLKTAVMNRLLHNDIIGAQRLLGMEINCDKKLYPNYVAGKKLGKRELDLMGKLGETRRYMDTQEVLQLMERIEKAYEIENYEVKTAYLKFLSGEYDNDGLPYCIISKYDYKIYLFSADHKLLACQPVLTGATVGNEPNDVGEHLKDPQNAHHTTPGGMYEVGGFFDKSSTGKNLIAVYGTHYILFKPLEGQYIYSDEYSMGGHGNVKGREWRFLSQKTKDKRASNGCTNIVRETFGEIINHLKEGSKIYICKDDEIDVIEDIGYNSNIIPRELANILTYNLPQNYTSKKWNTEVFSKGPMNNLQYSKCVNHCNVSKQKHKTPYIRGKYHNYHQKNCVV